MNKKERIALEWLGEADELIVRKIYDEMMEKEITYPQWLKQTEEGRKFLEDIMIYQRKQKKPQTEEQIIKGLNEAFEQSLILHKIIIRND